MDHRPNPYEIDRVEREIKAQEKAPSRIAELEAEVRILNRALTGMRNYMRIASEYQNDYLEKRLDGIQAALGEAAKYEPRAIKGRQRGRR